MRVLAPDGVLYCAYISRFASLCDGYRSGYVRDCVYRELVKTDLASGRHSPPPDDRYFTEAYFHHPSEIRGELRVAGFGVLAVCAVEGPFWLFQDIGAYLSEGGARSALFDYLDRIGEEPSMLGARAHLLSISKTGADRATRSSYADP
jgi:hypothetical protein